LSSDRERLWLRDIIDYSDDVRGFLEGMSFEQMCSDRKTVAAIERCLQCITKAAIRIGDVRMTVIAPDIPLHALRGLGNQLRHAYDAIDARTIYDTVVDDLPPLRAACLAALEQ